MNDRTYTINRDDHHFQECVNRLMKDPYNDGSDSREKIERTLWEWLKDTVDDLLANADEETHSSNPINDYFQRNLKQIDSEGKAWFDRYADDGMVIDS